MTTEPGETAKAAAPGWRKGLWLVALVLLGLQLLRDRSDAVALVLVLFASIGLFVALAFAAHHVETQTRRPRKSWLRWLLAVAVLALVLVVMPFALGADIVVGLILWVGFAVVGLAWAYFYERTEPL